MIGQSATYIDNTKDAQGGIAMTREELPEVLTPKHVQDFLGLSRRGTYDLMENPPFHVARVGRLYKISKQVFFKWLDGEQGN